MELPVLFPPVFLSWRIFVNKGSKTAEAAEVIAPF